MADQRGPRCAERPRVELDDPGQVRLGHRPARRAGAVRDGPAAGLHAGQRILVLEAEPQVYLPPLGRRVQLHGVAAGEGGQGGVQQQRSDAEPPPQGIDEHHRHPAHRRAVVDGGGRPHDPAELDRGERPTGSGIEKHPPVARSLVPAAGRAQGHAGRDVRGHERPHLQRRVLDIPRSRVAPCEPLPDRRQDVLQHRVENLRAVFGGRSARIAPHAGRAGQLQPDKIEVALHRTVQHRLRLGPTDGVRPHHVGHEGERDAGLLEAGVDVRTGREVRRDAAVLPEVEEQRPQRPVAAIQVADHRAEHVVAAVTVDEHQPREPLPFRLVGEVAEDAEHRLGPQGKRAPKRGVLVALTERQHGQERGVEPAGDLRGDPLDVQEVETHGQMRPVLLGGTHRQHENPTGKRLPFSGRGERADERGQPGVRPRPEGRAATRGFRISHGG